MSEETARLLDQLRERLHHTTRRMTWANLAFGAAVAVGAAAGVWLLATLLEAILWLGTTARTALAAAVATATMGVGAAMLARPLGRVVGLLSGPSETDVARAVGDHHPHVADRLVNLLQLADGKRSHAPAPLVDQAVQDLADDLDAVSFQKVEDFGRARRALHLASLPVVGILAFLLAAPSTFLGASERLLAPGAEFDRPVPFQLSVSPGATRLMTGDTLQISVQATGTVPETATLLLRDSTGGTDRVRLRADSLGRFRHTVPNVRRPLRYRIVAAPVRTEWYRVDVVARPLVRQLQLTVQPPAYTGRSSRTLDPNVGDVSALPGARVEVSATLGGPTVETAALAFGGGRVDTLSITDGTAEGTFTVRREDTYRLHLRSATGTTNRDPIRYRVTPRTDARPSVSFLAPESPADLQPDLAQPLRLRLRDDIGFRRVALFYRVVDADSSDFSSVELPLPSPSQSTQTLSHTWLLAQESGLDPEPGDVVEYYAKVWDNDTINGPKSGRTQTQRLRRPSLTDQYEQLDETQRSADDQLDILRQRADSTQRQFEELRRELRRTREADWQDRRQLKQLQQQQASMQQGAQQLSRTLEQMTRQMENNELSSPETTQQYQELKKTVDEMSSPEFQNALQRLKDAMKQGAPRRMQEAMERVRTQQQQRRKQLERTAELLKQLRAQQDLEEMARRAGDLSEQQRSLQKKTAEHSADASATAPESTDRQQRRSPSDSTAQQGASASDTPVSDSSAVSDSARASSRRSPSRVDSSAQRSRSSSPSFRPDSAAGGRPPASEDLARRQEQAAERMKELLREMREAEQAMQDVPSAPKQEMQKMNQQLQRQNLPQKMRENSRQLRRNQMQKARRGQRRMQQQLQRMQQRLQQMKSNMQGRQRSMNVSGLRTALENTLRLSRRQEAVRTAIEEQGAEGSTLRRYAREQNALTEGLKTVTDSLQTIARRVPRMSRAVQEVSGRALQAMESATTALDGRDGGQATGHQRTSMRHLNELALLLSDLLAKMQQQSQGGGGGMSARQMRQQLQQMAGQQQKLNRQIQQQLNQKQGQRLSGEQAQRRKALAQKQRRLRRQLQGLDDEAGSEARKQLLGDLSKIAEQMGESARDIEQNRQRRKMMERQQQILTRLLNAQQSLRTQGKKKERRGRSANGDSPQRTPGDLPDPDETDTLRRDLIRAMDMGYSADYEDLIRRYFELLQEGPAADTSRAPQR